MAQFTMHGSGPAAFGAIVMVVVAIVVALFWFVVAWRAMRAHERLADAVEKIAHGEARRGTRTTFHD
ncbi:MAG: hypothetical protein KDC95_08375 [Planctomycetes bacterium]|nr:hypothetical protein [Planctomycetota bacterium]